MHTKAMEGKDLYTYEGTGERYDIQNTHKKEKIVPYFEPTTSDAIHKKQPILKS